MVSTRLSPPRGALRLRARPTHSRIVARAGRPRGRRTRSRRAPTPITCGTPRPASGDVGRLPGAAGTPLVMTQVDGVVGQRSARAPAPGGGPRPSARAASGSPLRPAAPASLSPCRARIASSIDPQQPRRVVGDDATAPRARSCRPRAAASRSCGTSRRERVVRLTEVGAERRALGPDPSGSSPRGCRSASCGSSTPRRTCRASARSTAPSSTMVAHLVLRGLDDEVRVVDDHPPDAGVAARPRTPR